MRKKRNQLLAESLKIANDVCKDSILTSSDLERKHRERLIAARYLTEIIKGWYLLSTPEGGSGKTVWYSSFWSFIKHYLSKRFGQDGYCVSAESSLSFHAGITTIPPQIIILTKKASNTTVELLHSTSILLITDANNFPTQMEQHNGVNLMTIASAICRLTPSYYQNHPRNIEIVLKTSSLAVSEISNILLSQELISSAERIIGAYNKIGDTAKARQLTDDLKVAGFTLKTLDPFEKFVPTFGMSKVSSSYVGRIKQMWHMMRKQIIPMIPKDPGIKKRDLNKTVDAIRETYNKDAYHSLSIEGYQVTESLITQIESGEWDPQHVESDKKQYDALAAKGYSNSFKEVMNSIQEIYDGKSPGVVLEENLQSWYRQLHAPLLQANLIPSETLAGYRNQQVYIVNSRHVPPPSHAVLDCMEVLFSLLQNEESAWVKAVLGHFIFVFIHPYMDGNGRIGRFIMNLMFISGGYNWNVIRTEKRDDYILSLETASTKEDIVPFSTFINNQLEYWAANAV